MQAISEDGTFNVRMFSDPCRKIRKATKDVSISGDQFTFATLDVSERAESIDLQFKDELVGIERFRTE